MSGNSRDAEPAGSTAIAGSGSAPSSSPSTPTPFPYTDDELTAIARRHREAMTAWLVASAATVASCLVSPAVAFGSIMGQSLALAALLGVHGYACMAMARLTRAVGGDWITGGFVGLFCAIPGFQVLLMPLGAQEARLTLEARLGRVPMMGLTREQFAARLNCCRVCGYPLTGLRGPVCPECGASMTSR